MRRRVAVALAAVAFAGTASASRLVLNYEMRAMGFTVADATVTATIESGRYDVRVIGANSGLADLFGSLTLSAAAAGTIPSRQIEPVLFGTNNLYDGAPRRTRVIWTGPEAHPDYVIPTLEEEERAPIPDDARQDALDPISALLAFSLGEPTRYRCAGSHKVYDGRRSYTLTLDEGILEAIEIGDARVTALKCRITYERTGGQTPESWLSSSSGHEEAEIWFWLDADGRAVPVRLEGDAPIGSAVAELTALP